MSIEDLPIIKNRSHLYFDKPFKRGSYCEALRYIHFESMYISFHFYPMLISEKLLNDHAHLLTDFLKGVPYDITKDSRDIVIYFQTYDITHCRKQAKYEDVIRLINFMINSSFPDYSQFASMKQARSDMIEISRYFNNLDVATLDIDDVLGNYSKYQSDMHKILKYRKSVRNLKYINYKFNRISRAYPIRMKETIKRGRSL